MVERDFVFSPVNRVENVVCRVLVGCIPGTGPEFAQGGALNTLQKPVVSLGFGQEEVSEQPEEIIPVDVLEDF